MQCQIQAKICSNNHQACTFKNERKKKKNPFCLSTELPSMALTVHNVYRHVSTGPSTQPGLHSRTGSLQEWECGVCTLTSPEPVFA